MSPRQFALNVSAPVRFGTIAVIHSVMWIFIIRALTMSLAFSNNSSSFHDALCDAS